MKRRIGDVTRPWRRNSRLRSAVAVCLCLLAGAASAQPAAEEEPAIACGVARDRLLVPAQINGTGPYWFVLDLGLRRPVLHGGVANALGLTPLAYGDGVDEVCAEVAAFSAGGRPAQPETFAVADLAPLGSRLGTPLAGLLPGHQPGFELTVDFTRATVTWRPLHEARLAGPDLDTTTLKVDEDGMPSIEVAMNGTKGTWCALDLNLDASLRASEDLLESLGALESSSKRLRVLRPGGGPVVQCRVDQLSAGGGTVANTLCDVRGGPPRLGVGFLRHFRVTLNYEYGLARIEGRGATAYDEAPLVDCGILPHRRVGAYWQLAVAENSPSYHAGIRPGDLLLAINDLPLANASHADLLRLFLAREGDRANLLIQQKGTRRAVTVTAAPLL